MAAATEIRDRKTIADHVCAYMHENHRALTIDTLLSRPLDAMRMGATVAAKSQRISERSAKRIFSALRALEHNEGEAVDAIDDVCRAALSSRKRGDLKRDRY